MEDLLLDSTDLKTESPGVQEVSEENTEDSSTKAKTVNVGALLNNPALKVYSKEEIQEAKEKEEERIANRDANYLKMIYDSNLEQYREQHGYEMDGKSKRRLRKAILQRYKKGKIKIKDFNEFN